MSTDPNFDKYVKVEIVQQGLATSPQVKAGDKIAVHYTGKLNDDNGKKFDSSRDRGEPLEFVVGQQMVIEGWDEGLRGAQVEERRKLTIQPEKGYKDKGVGNGLIPPNSVLYFDCQIMKINGKGAGDYN